MAELLKSESWMKNIVKFRLDPRAFLNKHDIDESTFVVNILQVSFHFYLELCKVDKIQVHILSLIGLCLQNTVYTRSLLNWKKKYVSLDSSKLSLKILEGEYR